MALYASSMVMLLLVTLVNRKMDFRAIGIGGGFSKTELNYTAAGLGCIIVWLGILYSVPIFGNAPGGVMSALNQVNVFGPLGIILATIGAVKDSGGRRSTNGITITACLYFEYLGLLSFSKAGHAHADGLLGGWRFLRSTETALCPCGGFRCNGRRKLWLHLSAFRISRSG